MAQPSSDISPAKACKILEDGEIDGKPLTEAQRGMFGAACARGQKGFKVHRKCVKSLCKECQERLMLTQLQAQLKGLRKVLKGSIEVGDNVIDSEGDTVYVVRISGNTATIRFQGKESEVPLSSLRPQRHNPATGKPYGKAMGGVQVNDSVSYKGHQGIVVRVDKVKETADVRFNNGHTVSGISWDDLNYEG